MIVAQRGYIHDAQIWVELMVARWFDVCRHLIRMLLFLPARPSEPEDAGPFAAQQPAQTSKPERSWASQWRHFLFGSRRCCRAKVSQAERRPDRARFSRSQTIHTEMFRGGQTSGVLQQPHGAGGVRRVHSFSTTELLHQHAAQVSSTGDAVSSHTGSCRFEGLGLLAAGVAHVVSSSSSYNLCDGCVGRCALQATLLRCMM